MSSAIIMQQLEVTKCQKYHLKEQLQAYFALTVFYHQDKTNSSDTYEPFEYLTEHYTMNIIPKIMTKQ